MAYKAVELPGFGGIKLDEPDEVGMSGAVDLLNVELDMRGAVRSRDGYAKLTSSAGATRYDSVFSIAAGTTTSASTKFAGTGADDATVGSVAWSNPTNITADDATNATYGGASPFITAGTVTHYLKATNFAFAIPAGATITGIVVDIERLRVGGSGNGVVDSEVKLVKAGVVQSTNRADTTTHWPTGAYTVASYGGSSDLWGGSWTVADINGATFGVVLSVASLGGVNSIAVDFMRISVYYSPASTGYVLAGAAGSRIDAINTDGSVATTVATASDTQHSYAAFGSPATSAVYIGNSGTTIRKYASGAFSVPAGGPKAKFVAVQSPDNRLVAANIAAIPTGAGSTASTSLVHFSDAGTPETWSANNYVYLTPGDNEDIQGMAAWGNQLFVFKTTKYFVFYGNSTDSSGNPVFNYRPFTLGIGLAAPLALASSPIGLFFLDRRGIYLTSGGVPQRISEALDALFVGGTSRLYQGGAINVSVLSQASLCWFSGRLYFGFPQGSSTTNDRTFVYDPDAKEWTLWNVPMGAMSAVNAQPARLAFAYGQGANHIGIYAQNAYTDDAGTAIASRYRSGFYKVGNTASEEVTVTETILDGTGSPTFSVARDFAASVPPTGGGAQATVTLGTSPAYAQGRHMKAQQGRRFSYQLEATSGAWRVNSITHHIEGLRGPGLKTT